MKIAKPAPRRVLCLWLPRFPAERILKARQPPGAPENREPAKGRAPFAAWTGSGGRLWIVAAIGTAEAAGIHPGQSLADAKALCPRLATAAADRRADARALEHLAAWCRRFSPWTAVFGSENGGNSKNGGKEENTAAEAGEAGIWLEVTGCAHLVGG